MVVVDAVGKLVGTDDLVKGGHDEDEAQDDADEMVTGSSHDPCSTGYSISFQASHPPKKT